MLEINTLNYDFQKLTDCNRFHLQSVASIKL